MGGGGAAPGGDGPQGPTISSILSLMSLSCCPESTLSKTRDPCGVETLPLNGNFNNSYSARDHDYEDVVGGGGGGSGARPSSGVSAWTTPPSRR